MSLASAEHALLYKRDPRAALGWIAVSLLFPLVGPFLYFLFGINRVQTRAKKIDERWPFRIYRLNYPYETGEEFKVSGLEVPREFADIARISDGVTRRPLLGGNRFDLLQNGGEAYPAMINAIENAEHSIFLTTYIFETKGIGRRFIEALGDAFKRGVDVRVILDGVGEWYSIPKAGSLLRKLGIPVGRFLPPRMFPPAFHINLRNHRKILIADNRIGFVGGMNIRDRHLIKQDEDSAKKVADLHFRLTGPLVSQIEGVFLEDWAFCTGSEPETPRVVFEEAGPAICRAIVDGPNEDLDKLARILVGAVTSARQRIMIMTPYFLPPRELVSAIQTAALRGVEVSIILPLKNNLPFVHWATRNILWEFLQWGVQVCYHPPPFVHTKLFLIDDYYALIGSANIDPRSLRLNFELAVEVYDRTFSRLVSAHVQEARRRSKEVSLDELDGRPLGIKTRDALSWLFSPYL